MSKINREIGQKLKIFALPFHYIDIRQKIVFPNKKLIVFDCGKMNTLIRLLKDLKKGGHKVLIFTQMSKVLDIFEKCLSLCYFNYVRMDGGTKVSFYDFL